MAELRIEGAGEVIRQARQEKGVSLRALSELLGWDRSRLSRYETNRNALTLVTIQAIAEKLAVSPSLLLWQSLKKVHKDIEETEIGAAVEQIIVGLREAK